MKFHVLTLFPDMIIQGLSTSVIGRAAERNIININAVNIRDYTLDKHKKTDDYTYGGGAGMLMQAQPVYDAWREVSGGRKIRTVYVTPQGIPFKQNLARELAGEEEIIFLCGHYEGIDERALEEIVTDYVSIGDYVLTGGELPAMVMIDAIARLVPGVLNNEDSARTESFHNDLLEYPQYSRPEIWNGKKVPDVLLSGNHRKITQWRLEQSRERTRRIRPDLYEKYRRKEEAVKLLSKHKRNNIHMIESLVRGKAELLYAEGENLLIYNEDCKICMITAESREAGERMLALAPSKTRLFITGQDFMNEPVCSRFSFVVYHECYQVLYTKKEPLPVRHNDIRLLTIEALPYVTEHYDMGDEKHLKKLIEAGMMYGAYVDGRLAGFMGVHEDGSLGLLFVDKEHRRRHLGEALVCYCTNRLREQGYIPYAHIIKDNAASLSLQESIGYYIAEQTVFWLGTDA